MRNIKIKHFTKLVILVCILGVLLYFKNKADKQRLLQDKTKTEKYKVDPEQIAGVYRQTVAQRIRGLKWLLIDLPTTFRNYSATWNMTRNQTGIPQEVADDDDLEVSHLQFCQDFFYVAYWLERPPREQEVVGSIPGRDRPKSLKLVVVAFLLGAQDYGSSTRNGPPVSG